MAITTLDSGTRSFANLKYTYFTPWTSESTLGETTYDLINIVGDTTSIEPDENEVNEIPHEFSGTPVYENVTLGKKNFSTECTDLQNPVLKELFGWTVDDAGNAYAPAAYADLYCKIEIGFNSTDDVVILPKVKMNSRPIIASMKTDVARANITGTAYPAYVKVGSGDAIKTDMAIVKAPASGTMPTVVVTASAGD